MRGFERADAGSVASVEKFLRASTGEPVVLGTVYLASGRLGRAVATIARARAITLGPCVFFAKTDTRPHLSSQVHTALERYRALFVHECVHIWQYRREGQVSFLRQYLKAYFSGISKHGSVRRKARHSAYASIPFEREAFRLEKEWLEMQRRQRSS
ncbi:MAG: DUF4157 domain-containing protein [Blastocatellia bacterium]|nr:DUF4157 domain-containing protein [Blastocatellia bacterium]